MQFIHSSCTIQWILVYSQICATPSTINCLEHFCPLKKKPFATTSIPYIPLS